MLAPDSFLSAMGRALFPPLRRCSLCGAKLMEELDDGICPSCLARMPWIEAPFCPRCGLPGIRNQDRCPDCRDIPPSFRFNRSLWQYQGEARRVITLFKFERRPHLAYVLAEKIWQNLFCNLTSSYDILTYVPMYPKAERVRGYNQSRLLAERLATLTGLPCESLLAKKMPSDPQHLLSREQRWDSLRSQVFSLTASPGSKKVLLIDDVLTTGATAHFCSQLLLEAGAVEVVVLSLAR